MRHLHIFENARPALVRAHAIERTARIAIAVSIAIGIGIGSAMTTMAMILARIRASATVFIHQLILGRDGWHGTNNFSKSLE